MQGLFDKIKTVASDFLRIDLRWHGQRVGIRHHTYKDWSCVPQSVL